MGGGDLLAAVVTPLGGFGTFLRCLLSVRRQQYSEQL